MVWPYFLSYIIVRGQRARNFLSTYIMYPMSGYTTSMSFKNAVLQYTYLTSICHIQNGVPELKMTNLMEWCGRNNGAPKKNSQQHRGGSHVVARALSNRRVSSNKRNPPNCRNLGPKWAKRNGHSKMALWAKFSRHATLNAHICRGKSPEGSDRARCYAFNSFLLPYECRFNTRSTLVLAVAS